MSVAWQLEEESWWAPLQVVAAAPTLHRVPEQSPARRRCTVGWAVTAAVAVLLVLLALPIRGIGGAAASTAPTRGQVYVAKAGDTLASIAARAEPTHAGALAGRLATETGTTVVVPGEHIFIP